MIQKSLLAVISLFVLFSCKTDIERIPTPENLIPRDTMVLILQDMTVLESYITDKYPQVNIYQDLMRKSGDSLLGQYNISFERFNKSIDYYGSRQDEMQSIYTEVQDSLTWKINHLP